jgi:hypothetical protein
VISRWGKKRIRKSKDLDDLPNSTKGKNETVYEKHVPNSCLSGSGGKVNRGVSWLILPCFLDWVYYFGLKVKPELISYQKTCKSEPEYRQVSNQNMYVIMLRSVWLSQPG